MSESPWRLREFLALRIGALMQVRVVGSLIHIVVGLAIATCFYLILKPAPSRELKLDPVAAAIVAIMFTVGKDAAALLTDFLSSYGTQLRTRTRLRSWMSELNGTGPLTVPLALLLAPDLAGMLFGGIDRSDARRDRVQVFQERLREVGARLQSGELAPRERRALAEALGDILAQ